MFKSYYLNIKFINRKKCIFYFSYIIFKSEFSEIYSLQQVCSIRICFKIRFSLKTFISTSTKDEYLLV